jgi:hypothetical protein
MTEVDGTNSAVNPFPATPALSRNPIPLGYEIHPKGGELIPRWDEREEHEAYTEAQGLLVLDGWRSMRNRMDCDLD